MKNALIAAMLSAFLATPVFAASFNIPDSSPLASITVPDSGWKATKIDKGIELESSDDEVYLSIEAIELKALKELVAEAVIVLKRGGVTIDLSTEKQKSGKLLGRQFDDLGWSGKDKDGDVLIHLSVLSLDATHGILFTYWASPDGDKKYDPVISQMIESLKFSK
jgi:hypothetical protein